MLFPGPYVMVAGYHAGLAEMNPGARQGGCLRSQKQKAKAKITQEDKGCKQVVPLHYWENPGKRRRGQGGFQSREKAQADLQRMSKSYQAE